jgi:ABC-2 type transport system ATP-binding protein
MSQPLLEVKDLVKVYPPEKKGKQPFTAVDGISFELKAGEIVGLLGPNGAGKTTTIQMLLGLTTPTQGEINYFGKDLQHHREEVLERINFASAYSNLQGKMTIAQNLRIYGMLYRVQNIEQKIKEVAKLLEIEHLLDRKFWKLSSGQKTRAVLAKSLINEPELLLMDEPTASLDPDIVQKIIELIRKLQKEKKVAILYTSHNMEEITRLCDRVVFLYQGKVLAEDTPLGLTKLVGGARLMVTIDGEVTPAVEYLKSQKYGFKKIGDQVLDISLPEDAVPGTLFDLKKAGVWLTDIDIKKPSLEDVFLSFSREQAKGGSA